MDPEDAVITAYRCHGWTWLMGSTVLEVLAELTGTFFAKQFLKTASNQ